jgi:dimethylargininase
MFKGAICRTPGPDFASGLTTSSLGAPSLPLMLAQHAAYVACLEELGLQVQVLAPLPGYPDAHFVEDSALVLPEVAVVTRPGAAARRGEEEAMAPVLAAHRKLVRIEDPGTLDGGDVLVLDRTVLVGISERTNESGAGQLARLLAPHGYEVVPVPVAAGLHFKSSVNTLGGGRILVTEGFADRPELARWERIRVPAGEEYASNTLWVNGTLVTPSGYPRTLARLFALGLPVVELDTSEARKMDGGLTCMSLRF